LAGCLDVYRVVFAWRSDRRVALERLTAHGVFAATDRLAWCRAGPRSDRTGGSLQPAPGLHAARIEHPRMRRLSCVTRFPLWRIADVPLTGRRRAPRQLRLKYVQTPAFWAAARISVRPDQNLCSLGPTIQNLASASCVGILHFGPLGSALGTLFDSQPRLCSRGHHLARRSTVEIAGNLGPPPGRPQCLGGPDGICG